MDNRVTISDFIEYVVELGLPVWAGVSTFIVVFTIEIILAKRGVIIFNNNKRIDRARKVNHIIPAKMVRRSYKTRGDDNHRMYYCTYEYEVNDKRRVYNITNNTAYPPESITLYYDSNPKRVFSEYDNHPLDVVQKILFYIVPILAMVLVMYILGFKPEQ